MPDADASTGQPRSAGLLIAGFIFGVAEDVDVLVVMRRELFAAAPLPMPDGIDEAWSEIGRPSHE